VRPAFGDVSESIKSIKSFLLQINLNLTLLFVIHKQQQRAKRRNNQQSYFSSPAWCALYTSNTKEPPVLRTASLVSLSPKVHVNTDSLPQKPTATNAISYLSRGDYQWDTSQYRQNINYPFWSTYVESWTGTFRWHNWHASGIEHRPS
jgi:hypothetical protein